MLKITGYSDKYSAHPGEEVKFYINAENNDSYEVQLVRLIHGDTNPEGPGYKEAEIDASCNGCLLYTSPSPRDLDLSRMPSSA